MLKDQITESTNSFKKLQDELREVSPKFLLDKILNKLLHFKYVIDKINSILNTFHTLLMCIFLLTEAESDPTRIPAQ